MSTEDDTQQIDQFAARVDSYEPPTFDPTLDLFIYGQTGTGKTTLVKTLKDDCMDHDGKCMLLTCDKGNESIQSAIHDKDGWLQSFPVDSMNDVRGALKFLIGRDHPFRWVVLDDTTRMAQIFNNELKTEFGDDTWGRYGALNDRFRVMLRGFRGEDINSLFLAREGHKENSAQKTAAFPGKALGEGNDKSSVLHEFTLAGRMVCEPTDTPDQYEHVDADGHRYYVDFQPSDAIEAKKRDEFHALDPQEEPDISSIRRRWAESIEEHL